MPRNVTEIEILVNKLINFLQDDVLLGALDTHNIEYEICFDCDLWNNGFILNSDTPDSRVTVISPISITFVNILSDTEVFLCSQLSSCNFKDFGYKSQIDRLLSMILDLKNKVLAIRCIDICNDTTNIISHLLYTLIQTILQLVTILETINGLLSYIGSCGCNSIVLVDLLMGKVINTITCFQSLLQDWYSIVMTFLHYSSVSTKSYIASYVPKQPIIPPPNMPIGHACVPCPPKPYPHQPNNINNCSPSCGPYSY